LRDCGHPRNVNVWLELRLLAQFKHSLADIDGVVADTFQVGSDFEPSRDEAQIARRWLMQGEEPYTTLVALDVHPVHIGITRDGLAGFFGIALDQRLDGVGNLTFNETTHLQQTGP
jgi:hypothetical protein